VSSRDTDLPSNPGSGNVRPPGLPCWNRRNRDRLDFVTLVEGRGGHARSLAQLEHRSRREDPITVRIAPVQDWRTTTTALLEGLGGQEETGAWQELEHRIRPVVCALARTQSLDSHEAADVAQDTFLTFVRLFREGRYDREKGRLGAWILGIARNRIRDAQRSRNRQPRRAESVELRLLAEEDPLDELWERESKKAMLDEAMERLLGESRLEPSTLNLFRRFVIDQVPARKLAAELGVTENAVYQAKRTCMTRLRSILETIEASWELLLS
jgi:RNA polymerase sigma-70 factor (ECF subfamily)